MTKEVRTGIDIGAVSIGAAVLGGEELTASDYRFHNGDIRATLRDILASLDLDGSQAKVAFTGRGASALKVESLDDVIATIEGVKWMSKSNPRFILMIGGESFLLIEFLPMWQRFFAGLGFKEVLVAPQDKEMLRRGKNLAQSEFCAPLHIAHGHVQWLKKEGVDRIFLPVMLEGPKTGSSHRRGYFCYYTSFFSTIVKYSPVLAVTDKLISPFRWVCSRICR